MNGKGFLCIAVTTFALSGCVMNRVGGTPETLTLRNNLQGMPVRIEIDKGDTWSRRMQAGPFIFNILPQIVIWAEDGNGRLLDTLYITGAGKKTVGHAGKQKKGAAFYPECFPVWASRLADAGGALPSPKNLYPDTVTSATPSTSFTVNTKLGGTVKPAALFLEINQSGDVNGTWTAQNNDWAGQPSLVYRALLADTAPGSGCRMELAGHGGRLGETPEIHTDVSTLDTALTQVKEITVTFE